MGRAQEAMARAAWIGAAAALAPSPLLAYVDPGTTNVVFSLWPFLGPILGAIAVAFSFLFRPIRRLAGRPFRILFRSTRGARGSAPRPGADPEGGAP